jgi:hypothetical protein
MLSISHEFGYFLIVGLPFLAMSSAYDYLSNSVLWLPPTVLLVSVASCVMIILENLGVFKQGKGDAISDAGFPSEKKEKRALLGSLTGAFVLLILAGVIALVFLNLNPPDLWVSLAGPAVLAYVALMLPLAVIYYRSLSRRETAQLSGVLFVVPLIVMFFGFIGAQRARWNIGDVNNLYVLLFKEGQGASQQALNSVQVLRSFDKGLLVRNPANNMVEFIRWEALKSVARKTN